MNVIDKQINGDRLVIVAKGRGNRYEQQFFLAIQEAISEGYRFLQLDEISVAKDWSLRNWGVSGRAVMVKGEYVAKTKEEVKAEETPAEEEVVEAVEEVIEKVEEETPEPEKPVEEKPAPKKKGGRPRKKKD